MVGRSDELPVWAAPRSSRRHRTGGGTVCAAVMLVVLVALAVTTHGRASGREAGRCDVSSADRASEKLDLSGCELSALPAFIADFASLRHLDASNNHLDGLPELPRSLTRLFLSKNRFTSLPSQLSRLPNLTMLGMRANRLAGTLPAGVLPPSINWLILTDNQLDGLPSDLGAPSSVDDGGPARAVPRPRPCELVKLMLANNALRSLPPSMAACSRLELVRLSNNRLDEVPSWLLQLPRLAWLALASNPAVESARPPASLPTLALADLGVDAAARPLGSGTSGVVYGGSMAASMAAGAGMAAAAGAPVAVKLFKTAHTSDGLTADEVRAAAAAGSHAGLVSTLALVRPSAAHGATAAGTGDIASRGEGEPQPPAGIVLEWVRGYSPLGNPPTFKTISRDTYGARIGEAQGGVLGSGGLPLAQTLVTLSSICGALVHLHANQLAHGDVYAQRSLVPLCLSHPTPCHPAAFRPHGRAAPPNWRQ